MRKKEIFLTKEKITGLKKELKTLKKRNYEGIREAGVDHVYSFRDAASSNAQRLQFETKVKEIEKILKYAKPLADH